MKLTDKQEKFISEYLIDLNATQAAIRAGYSAHTAKDIGCQNLAKVYIAEAIAKAKDIAAKRNETTVDLIDKMHKKAFEVSEENQQGSAMTTAAMNLAKLHGMITDKKEVDANLTVEVVEYSDE